MTLTTITEKVLAAIQSGAAEAADEPLRELGAVIRTELQDEDLPSAMATLHKARETAYANRAHIVQSLRELERSGLYSESAPDEAASWQLSG